MFVYKLSSLCNIRKNFISTSCVFIKKKTVNVEKEDESLRKTGRGLTYVTVEEGSVFMDLPVGIHLLIDPLKLLAKDTAKLKLLPAICPPPNDNLQKTHAEQFFFELLTEVSSQNTIHGIATLLESIPLEVMTSRFCAYAVKNITRIEMARISRNSYIRGIEPGSAALKTACVSVLTNRLCQVGEPGDTLNVLEVLATVKFFEESLLFRQKLIDQVVNDIMSGVFSLRYVIKAINLFERHHEKPEFGKYCKALWIGLLQKKDEISHKNIRSLFECIDLQPKCGPYVVALVDEQLDRHISKLNYEDIHKILHTLNSVKITPKNTTSIISQWVNRYIHTLLPNQLDEILMVHMKIGQHDLFMERALERYVRGRGLHERHINTFIHICVYITNYRIRNETIMDVLSNILVEHTELLEPRDFTEIFSSFGYVSYTPNLELKFWTIVENYIHKNFERLYVEDLMHNLMAFIYLEHFTLRFVNKLHSPAFKEQIKVSIDECKTNYHTYDTALSLETETKYGGPYVKSVDLEFPPKIQRDPNVIKMMSALESRFAAIFQKWSYKYTTFYQIPGYPLSALYSIDILAYPESIASVSNLARAIRDHPHKFICFLMHVPSHVCSDNKLIGPQRMRRRHLRRMGLFVGAVEYSKYLEIIDYPHFIDGYIKYCMTQVERPFAVTQ